MSRLDDLRVAEARRIDESMKLERERLGELLQHHVYYTSQLATAEAKRLDSIRATDAAAVGIAQERAIAQAAVLATQVSASAEAMRQLVATTATTQAASLAQLTQQLTDRLAAVEKTQYESRGSGTGMRDMWGWIFGAIVGFVSVAAVVYNVLK